MLFNSLKTIRLLALALGFAVLTSACIYRMPTDDDICLVPMVNNPELTREPAPTLQSGGGAQH